MYKNNKILNFCFVSGKLKINGVYNRKYLPPHLIKDLTSNRLSVWLNQRLISSSREDIPGKLGNLSIKSRFALSLKSNAASLSDPYWIREASQNLDWNKINFFDNPYSYNVGNVLFGIDQSINDNFDYRSPDSTTNGVHKKTWRRVDGVDKLYKMGRAPDYQEAINEVFSSRVAENFQGLDFVDYKLANINNKICSVCENFVTKEEEFIPAFSIYQTVKKPVTVSIYNHLINTCKDWGIYGVEEFINRMLVFDYLIGNTDRHMGNFGFMRNTRSLRFTRVAPLFDNGTSLLAEHLTQGIKDIETMDVYANKDQIARIPNLGFIKLLEVQKLDDYLYDLCNEVQLGIGKRDKICHNFQNKVTDLFKIQEERSKEKSKILVNKKKINKDREDI